MKSTQEKERPEFPSPFIGKTNDYSHYDNFDYIESFIGFPLFTFQGRYNKKVRIAQQKFIIAKKREYETYKKIYTKHCYIGAKFKTKNGAIKIATITKIYHNPIHDNRLYINYVKPNRKRHATPDYGGHPHGLLPNGCLRKEGEFPESWISPTRSH